MSAGIKYEKRVVRPFANITESESSLNEVSLLVDDEKHEPGNIELPELTFKEAKLTLTLPSKEEIISAIAGAPVPHVDCGLVILATGKMHRGSVILAKEYLESGSWPNELVIDRAPDDLVLGDIRGFKITVAIVLLNDLVPEPLKPSIAGTWLTRRDFHIRPESQDLSFSPKPLTDEVRASFNLPKNSLRYIRVSNPLKVEDLSDAVDVYVDDEILERLIAKEDTSFSIQFQTDLAIATHESLVTSILRTLADETEKESPTVGDLDQFPSAFNYIERLSEKLKMDMAELFELVREDSARFRASLESLFDAYKMTLTALKEA